MLTSVYATLRAAGRTLELPIGDAPGIDEAAARVVATAGDVDEAARLVELLGRRPQPEALLDLSGYAVKGDDDYEQARQALEQAALNAVAARDRALLERLLQSFEHSYQAAKDRESALDFEDLQLRARNLLRDDPAIREREQLRFRQVCVDEFQDTNRLQCELIDLIARDELFFVGDEFQSIYRFRHADVEVFKERREQIGEVLPLTQNWRSRPEVLAVVNELFGATFGDEFQKLVAAGPLPRSGLGRRRRAAGHRQGELQGHGRHLAARRGAGCRPPRAGARRRRRGRAGRDRPALRRRHGCRAVRGGAARARPADLPRDRAGLFRPAAGGRPARLPAAPAQPLRRRSVRHRARLALRRPLERRPRRPAPECDPAGRCTRRSRRACRRACPSATGVCSRPFASGTAG